jgi:3-oxoacyl-[acyl-carrier protein] reductase
MKLKNQVIIITGSGNGLGKTFALGLAAKGARLVLADIDFKAAQLVEQEIKINGGEATAINTDISSETSVIDMVEKTIETYGSIDVVINNAAILATLKRTSIDNISVNEWDKVMSVNLRGMFLVVKSVLPQMKKQLKGKIINISSNTVLSGAPFIAHYVTSKAGVLGFTRAAAKELGEYGICVNSITPGLTNTEAAERVFPKDRFKAVENLRAINREQIPSDLLGTVVFLASNYSDFITGQNINVDGGHCLY